jgi:hypothetical protein
VNVYAGGVIRWFLGGLLLIALGGLMLRLVLRPARAIWQGDESRLPDIPRWKANGRTYFGALLWMVPVYAGITLLGLFSVVYALLPHSPFPYVVFGAPALILSLAAVPLVAVHLCVIVFNWPPFLIPVRYRKHRRVSK